MKTSEHVAAFLDFLRESRTEYHLAIEDEKESNAETQDILHSLEVENHTYHERGKIAQELTLVRRRRRMAKDKIAHLQPIAEWAYDNKAAVKSIERLLGEVRKAEKDAQGRFYVQKTDVLKRTLDCSD